MERREGPQGHARREDLECVWTGRPLAPPRFHVDHALPFALWRNNDLWNLLPSDPRVNADKRDSIPATELLRSRREAIVRCWELTQRAFPRRFAHEARAQVGQATGSARGAVDLARLFERLVESAEVTAVQRACPRWSPAA